MRPETHAVCTMLGGEAHSNPSWPLRECRTKEKLCFGRWQVEEREICGERIRCPHWHRVTCSELVRCAVPMVCLLKAVFHAPRVTDPGDNRGQHIGPPAGSAGG